MNVLLKNPYWNIFCYGYVFLAKNKSYLCLLNSKMSINFLKSIRSFILSITKSIFFFFIK